MNRWLTSIFALVFFVATTSAQDKPRLESAPKLSVGDRWDFKQTDIGNKKEPISFSNEVKEANGEFAWLYGKSGASEFWWKYDVKHAKNIERRKFSADAPDKRGEVAVSVEKNDSRIQFPLEVGKSYTVKEYWTNQEQTLDRELKVTVQSYEKVRIGAGELDAYRISGEGWWNNRSNHASGRYEFAEWFAPAAKRVVKYEWKLLWQNQTWDQGAGEVVEFNVSP
jgi:hypothetical protein